MITCESGRESLGFVHRITKGVIVVLQLIKGSVVVAATHNQGKAKEISKLLDGLLDVKSAKEYGLEPPDETEISFVGNAILKARYAALETGLIAIADDSGLSIDALGGEPGIYSARWAGPDHDFVRAMEIIEHKINRAQKEAGGSVSNKAHFTCALSVVWPSEAITVFEGIVKGSVSFPPRGDNGFGYDPIFIPDGYDMSFGQMRPEEKEAISHRAQAFKLLKDALF
jgi:XTP/dITP diphosphohydrolase